MKTAIMLAAAAMMVGCAGTGQVSHEYEASGNAVSAVPSGPCIGFGPQTPRDIANKLGNNKVEFGMAPPAQALNLCNMHFHNAAENRAPEFSLKVTDEHGKAAGYACGISKTLSKAELQPYPANACKGVKPGDTIEMHWVHTSCDVAPGPGLGSCLSDACANPSLRVETQVFTVVNDDAAPNFMDMARIVQSKGKYQAPGIPNNTGAPVQFLGSTTGPKYNESVCSPLQVSWSVRPSCAKVSISSLSKWCESNAFNEDHAHGVRELVTHPDLLSPIK